MIAWKNPSRLPCAELDVHLPLSLRSNPRHSTSLFPQINPDDHVGSLVYNGPVLLYFEVNRIHVHNSVHSLERPILPFLNEGYDFVRDVGNERGRDFDAVQVLGMVLNLPCADTFGVKGDDLVFNACHVLLMLLYHQGLTDSSLLTVKIVTYDFI